MCSIKSWLLPLLLYLNAILLPVIYICGNTDGYTAGRTTTLVELIQPQKIQFVEFIAQDIVSCESGGDHFQKNPSGASGVAQFKKKTFDWFKKLAKREDLNWTNEDDQLWLLHWALSHGYGKHWECYDGAVKKYINVMLQGGFDG